MSKTQAPDPAPELLPCPFCGDGMTDPDDTVYPQNRERTRWTVTCNCGAEVIAGSEGDAIAAWNRRIPAPEGVDENAVAMAWNTVRAEARKLDGGRRSTLYDLLAAVEQYGDRRAALAAPRVPEGEDIADLRESAAMLNEIGLLLRNHQNRFVGSWVEIVRQMCEALAAPAPQEPVPMTDAEIGDLYARWKDCDGASFADLMRAVERHHGIPAPQTKEPTHDR